MFISFDMIQTDRHRMPTYTALMHMHRAVNTILWEQTQRYVSHIFLFREKLRRKNLLLLCCYFVSLSDN